MDQQHTYEQRQTGEQDPQRGLCAVCGKASGHPVHVQVPPKQPPTSSQAGRTLRASTPTWSKPAWTNIWLGLIFILLVITNLFGIRIGPYVECEANIDTIVECEDKVGITWGR